MGRLVEVAGLDAPQEHVPLRPGVLDSPAPGVSEFDHRVAGDVVTFGNFDAAAGLAEGGLLPGSGVLGVHVLIIGGPVGRVGGRTFGQVLCPES